MEPASASSNSDDCWSHVLASLDTGDSLDATFTLLAKAIEDHPGGIKCSISVWRTDTPAARTFSPSTPELLSLPRDKVTSSPPAQAASTLEPVTCTDLSAEGQWHDSWRDTSASLSLRGALFLPIISARQSMTAVFELFFRDATPPPCPAPLIPMASHIARIAMNLRETLLAEQLASESVQRFRFLAESLPEKVFTASGQGDLSYINEQWERYTGLPVEEIMTRGWRDFVHPEDIEEKQTSWIHSMSTGQPFECEHRFRREDGVYRWHLSRAHPLRDTDGSIRLWLGSNIDIDDLKRAQFELGESESRLRLAMEAGGLGFWDWMLNDKIRWSVEHNRIMGIDPNLREGTVEVAMQHIHPGDHAKVRHALQYAQDSRVDLEVEFRITLDSGATRWIASRGRTYYDDQTGRPVRMIGVIRDVTERKKDEDQLRKNQEELRAVLRAAEHAREQAEAASRAKDQFLAVLSHELRTPLTPVLMAVSAASSDKNLPDHIRDALQMIQRNIKIEARLIEDLLDLTRIVRNKIDLQLAPLDLHHCLRQALEICQSDIEGKHHLLNLDLTAAHSRIIGDQDRLQQVFWNLIKNAVKFTPDQGQITVRTFNRGKNICVEISDSGIGIAPEALPFIFHPFKQAEQSFVRRYGGLGLGLAISKATVDAHTGHLHAESKGRDQGAIFTVELSCIDD